jgi:hypothetical protein
MITEEQQVDKYPVASLEPAKLATEQNYYSDEYALKFGARWTGAVNTNWQTAGNWTCGSVPDQYTDVTIVAGAAKCWGAAAALHTAQYFYADTPPGHT